MVGNWEVTGPAGETLARVPLAYDMPITALVSIQIHVNRSALLALAALLLAGCTAHDRSPDEIRKQTAHATSTAARDAKAIVQGVVEGVKQQRTININRSSIDDLKSLPGIDDAVAKRIIEHRPYSDSYDLVKRHIISRKEYDRISGKVEAR
jgi:DNA uptake protein ComE-like DNA-binding protein